MLNLRIYPKKSNQQYSMGAKAKKHKNQESKKHFRQNEMTFGSEQEWELTEGTGTTETPGSAG